MNPGTAVLKGLSQRHDVSGDVALVRAAKAGDRQAFGEIVTRYQPLLHSLAHALTGNVGESEEIVQEAFVVAWTRLHDLRDEERFRAWLCGTTRMLVRRLRRKHHRRFGLVSLPLHTGPEIASNEPSPLDRAMRSQEDQFLSTALGRVPESYRAPLVLFYGHGQSIEQVAEALNISPKNVGVRLTRARQMLHERVIAALQSVMTDPEHRKRSVASIMAAVALVGPTQAGAAAPARPANDRGGVPRATAGLVLAPAVVAGLVLWASGAREGSPTATAARPQASPAAGDSPVRHAPAALLLPGPKLPGEAAPWSAVFDFDFEDGVIPSVFSEGELVAGPPRPGNRHALVGTVRLGYDRPVVTMGDIARPGTTVMTYSGTKILTFDFWMGSDAGTDMQIVVYDNDRSNNYYFYRKGVPDRVWAHAELRLVDFMASGNPKPPMNEGDSIRNLSFSSDRVGGDRFYVDNIRLVDFSPAALPAASTLTPIP